MVKAANVEFNRWANFLFRRPYTTQVVAAFVDEIEDAFAKIRDHPDRYPLEGYSDYRKFGPTPKHHFKVITPFVTGFRGLWPLPILPRRVRYWVRRKLKR